MHIQAKGLVGLRWTILSAVLGALLVTALIQTLDDYRIALGVCAFVSGAFVFAILVYECYRPRKGFRLSSPIFWGALPVLLYTCILPLWLALVDGRWFLGRDVSRGLGAVALISLLSSLSFTLGILIVRSYRSFSRRAVSVSSISSRYATRLILVGLAGFGAWLAFAGLSPASLNAFSEAEGYGSFGSQASGPIVDYLGYFRLTAIAGATMLAIRAMQTRSRWKFLLGLALILGSLVTGLRFPSATALAAILIVATTRRPISVKVGLVLTGLLLAFFGYVAVQRAPGPSAGVSTADVGEAVLNGFDLIRPLAATAEYQDSSPLLLGESYLYVGAQVVPRDWWPQKPLPPTMEVIWAATNRESGFAVPLWGEAYFNFGYMGVAGFMFIVGVGLAVWQRTIDRRGVLMPWETLGLPMLVVALSRSLFVQAIYLMVFLVLPVWLMDRRARRGRRSRVRVHAAT